MDWKVGLLLLPGLVIGLTLHEAAHAVTAMWLGDDTAKLAGRVSLNPLRHLSVLGTACLFVLGFGWGKPVVVNINNFKRPRFHYFLSSIAGPAANLLLCGVSLGALYLHPPGLVGLFFTSIYLVNAILAIINLLPVPPLDGSKIWPLLIPSAKPAISAKWNQVWMVVLLIAFFTGALHHVIAPALDFLSSLMPAAPVAG